jgi:hypothetical protein
MHNSAYFLWVLVMDNLDEKKIESMCICPTCPTYKAYGKEDDYIAYCLHGKSKNLAEHGCKCGLCPVYDKKKFVTTYFCTRDTEAKQKMAIAKQ